jgi:hypothetical protein
MVIASSSARTHTTQRYRSQDANVLVVSRQASRSSTEAKGMKVLWCHHLPSEAYHNFDHER